MRILFWFRSDLRLADNTGLHEASRDAGGEVVPFHTTGSGGEADAGAAAGEAAGTIAPARVRFTRDSLADLARAIERAGSRLALDHAPALEAVPRAAQLARADAVCWNDEYEPALERRDEQVERALRDAGVAVRRFHDRLLVPPGAVLTRTGTPFVVYTAFRRACEALPVGSPLPAVPRLAPHDLPAKPLEPLGAAGTTETRAGGVAAARRRLERFVRHGLPGYAARRDFLADEVGSCLSADLRCGTLSPRTVAAAVRSAARAAPGDRALADGAEKFMAELRWRDFYAHVLHHFPHSEQGAFRRGLSGMPWRGAPGHFAAWREGRTGYPVVDAAMRELAATGFMHNRGRMIVASFLTKDLLLDWRLGERHFMRHLVDGDLASNNGGWQWAAGTGTDAQPWFRVFNPVLQGRRFDPEGAYVRRWVPELGELPARWIHAPWEAPVEILRKAGAKLGADYPEPIVEHEEQRAQALAMYRLQLGLGSI
jgi:deoxyribodipyrimidine photo-lyase